MEALKASYGGASSDSDIDDPTPVNIDCPMPLPPPPLSLLNLPLPVPSQPSRGTLDRLQTGQASRVRSFPHIDGNYALHVYIPVYIPSIPKKELVLFLKKISSLVPGLHVVDVDIPLNILCKDDLKLEQKLQFQKRYWIDFSKLQVFVNDDHTRTFLSIEVITGGLAEIKKQIHAVNEVYRLHKLPEFYKDPRPHISVAWALGDISDSLQRGVMNN
ncbi:hypothetical protein SLA2020_285080 [Shorea laevis]